ncbi:hypothetical protein [Nonomuraea salmonea]|uniref:hypothetical protein n=1 Tax=Nonomuraea salmonea TaxID=46181 RepID=UPI002FE81587
MAEPPRIEDLRKALTDRAFPTVGLWNRIEGRPRTAAFDRALRAEVRDPLWLLTRQWQLGEFRGSDAGTAVTATYSVATATPPASGPGRARPRTFQETGRWRRWPNGVPCRSRPEPIPSPTTCA